jgi:hypothetical protein
MQVVANFELGKLYQTKMRTVIRSFHKDGKSFDLSQQIIVCLVACRPRAPDQALTVC